MASKLRQNKNLVPIRCTEKGYTQIVIYYRVDNAVEVDRATQVALELVRQPSDLDTYDCYDPRLIPMYRVMCLIVGGYEGWNLPYPAPTPDDPMSYAPMCSHSKELIEWIMNQRGRARVYAETMLEAEAREKAKKRL